MTPEDIKELREEIAQLQAEAKRAKRDRTSLLLLLGALAAMLLGVKIHVDESGKTNFSFDGAAINTETLLQITSIVVAGSAGIHAIQGRRDDNQR